jgi:CheY-like chemotaxis protein
MSRARGLTQQLLTFSKGGEPVRKTGSLIPFVRETVQFALSGSNVACNCDIPETLWQCNFDRNQVGRVIDNIVINAQQAMPMGGTIEVSARNVLFDEKKHPPLANGRYVAVYIKDHGIGIPQEILPRIFDPFFTTKEKGHGLGLATCYSIVSRHGGAIDVESEQGKGATFIVYLPASAEAASTSIKEAVIHHKGCGTIIVLDDEEFIRNTIAAILELHGYTVVLKKDGKDVVDFFTKERRDNHPIAGIFLDLTIPGGMGGKRTVLKIREEDPDIPVFVVSGYAADPVMAKPRAYGFTDSLCKPFRISELAELLEKYLKTQK